VVVCGDDWVDAVRLVRELETRGMTQLLCEGGTTLFGTLLAADVVDELCLTVSPLLEGGEGPRISVGASPGDPRELALDLVLLAGSMMLTRYSRNRAGTAGTLAQ
jgi:riboflavin biosynthesis pyrimidine reductase